MEINRLIEWVTEYANTHPAGAAAAGVILLFILIRRPKMFFVMLLIGVAGIGVMMLFDRISATMGTGRLPFLN